MLIKVVIIDFGKASNADQGKLYKLTDHEKEQYKACHPHIAPDLHNGLCRQSVMSDVYALGRIINTVNGVSYLQNKDMQEFLKPVCTTMRNHALKCQQLKTILIMNVQ